MTISAKLLAAKETVHTAHRPNIKNILLRPMQWEALWQLKRNCPRCYLWEKTNGQSSIDKMLHSWRNHFQAFIKNKLFSKKSRSDWWLKDESLDFCLPTYLKNRCQLSLMHSGRVRLLHDAEESLRSYKQLLASSDWQQKTGEDTALYFALSCA